MNLNVGGMNIPAESIAAGMIEDGMEDELEMQLAQQVDSKKDAQEEEMSEGGNNLANALNRSNKVIKESKTEKVKKLEESPSPFLRKDPTSFANEFFNRNPEYKVTQDQKEQTLTLINTVARRFMDDKDLDVSTLLLNGISAIYGTNATPAIVYKFLEFFSQVTEGEGTKDSALHTQIDAFRAKYYAANEREITTGIELLPVASEMEGDINTNLSQNLEILNHYPEGTPTTAIYRGEKKEGHTLTMMKEKFNKYYQAINPVLKKYDIPSAELITINRFTKSLQAIVHTGSYFAARLKKQRRMEAADDI